MKKYGAIYLYICMKLISTLYILLPPMSYVDRNYIIITVERCVPLMYTHRISQIFYLLHAQVIGLAVHLL
jgi:hypothetical protein